MRLQYIMRHRQTKKHQFKHKSTWVPPATDNTNLENYLEATKLALVEIQFHNTKDNMTRAERIAIKTLSKNTNLTLKPFDKGRGTAVMNTIDYIRECERQLGDSNYYTKLATDDTKQTVEKIHKLTTEMYNKKHIDLHTYKYIDPFYTNTRTPRWYVLPKLHKAPPTDTKFAGRPIISGCSSPTFHISEFLDHFLKQIVEKQPTYIKDTTDFIRKMDSIQAPNNAILVTLDVVSMYTNTQHDDAIQAIGKALNNATQTNNEQTNIHKPPTEYMLAMLNIILKNNTFEFNNEFYKQTCGCAMGSPSSPNIADITFHELELKIIHQHTTKISLWCRFRDDIF
ncbi:uncharacterized protein [Ptychodera flava]|uniref:uncharacterized protein n=1 Tax=Ptychodera flava TaxID=63121 RepID=UPI00396A3FB8